jgi:hypothetical protein
MRIIGLLVLAALFGVAGCSSISYRTYFDDAKDPTYDFAAAKTVGLAPTFWTAAGRANQVDELKEKQFLLYMKSGLEKKGFSAAYLESDKLEERAGLISLKPLEAYPDLILTCEFGIQPSVVKVPGEAFGRYDSAGGFYSKTQSYEVQTYELSVAGYLWSGAPGYRRKVWYARIIQGSPAPDLSARAPEMIARLFREKLPVINAVK